MRTGRPCRAQSSIGCRSERPRAIVLAPFRDPVPVSLALLCSRHGMPEFDQPLKPWFAGPRPASRAPRSAPHLSGQGGRADLAWHLAAGRFQAPCSLRHAPSCSRKRLLASSPPACASSAIKKSRRGSSRAWSSACSAAGKSSRVPPRLRCRATERASFRRVSLVVSGSSAMPQILVRMGSTRPRQIRDHEGLERAALAASHLLLGRGLHCLRCPSRQPEALSFFGEPPGSQAALSACPGQFPCSPICRTGPGFPHHVRMARTTRRNTGAPPCGRGRRKVRGVVGGLLN